MCKDGSRDNVKEFRFGDSVAYGTFENWEEYCLVHAPVQNDIEVIEAALHRRDSALEMIDVWGSVVWCHGCGNEIVIGVGEEEFFCESEGEWYCEGCWNAPREEN